MPKFDCPRCGGKGYIEIYSNVLGGVCFQCHGKGYIEQKNAPKKSFKFLAVAPNGKDFPFWLRARNLKEAQQKAFVEYSLKKDTPFFVENEIVISSPDEIKINWKVAPNEEN